MVSAEIAVAMLCRMRILSTVRCEVLFVFYRRKMLDPVTFTVDLLPYGEAVMNATSDA